MRASDRKEELNRATPSVIQQTEAVESIVLDDGSIDGASEMRAEFPQVRLDRSPRSLGKRPDFNLPLQSGDS